MRITARRLADGRTEFALQQRTAASGVSVSFPEAATSPPRPALAAGCIRHRLRSRLNLQSGRMSLAPPVTVFVWASSRMGAAKKRVWFGSTETRGSSAYALQSWSMATPIIAPLTRDSCIWAAMTRCGAYGSKWGSASPLPTAGIRRRWLMRAHCAPRGELSPNGNGATLLSGGCSEGRRGWLRMHVSPGSTRLGRNAGSQSSCRPPPAIRLEPHLT